MKLSLLLLDWQLSQGLTKAEGDLLRNEGWEIRHLLDHDLFDLEEALRLDLERRYPDLKPFECEDPFEGRRVAIVVPGHHRISDLKQYGYEIVRVLPEDNEKLHQALQALLVLCAEDSLSILVPAFA